MTTIDLTTLIPRCHEAAKAKGFWGTKRDAGEALMLVVSELGEAQEAHRKGRHATLNTVLAKQMAAFMDRPQDVARDLFDKHVKDTVADELADAYIRLCDFVGGFGGPIKEVQTMLRHSRKDKAFAEVCPHNFGGALFHATSAITTLLEAIEEGDVNGSIAMLCMGFHTLEIISQREAIDLATHIDLKLRYNATRPIRHGKAY